MNRFLEDVQASALRRYSSAHHTELLHLCDAMTGLMRGEVPPELTEDNAHLLGCLAYMGHRWIEDRVSQPWYADAKRYN